VASDHADSLSIAADDLSALDTSNDVLVPPPSNNDVLPVPSEGEPPTNNDVIPAPSEGEEVLGRGRRIKFPNRWVYGGKSRHLQLDSLSDTQPSNLVTLSHIDWDTPYLPQCSALNSFESLGTNPHNLEIDWWHPMTLAAKASSIDEPRYFEMIRLPDDEIEDWFQAMESESDGLASKNTYSILDRN
jgi:hypothetical protein